MTLFEQATLRVDKAWLLGCEPQRWLANTREIDEEGVEFDSAIEARAQAIEACGQMMKDAADKFWGSRPWNVTVTDATGLILWQISVDGYASPAMGGDNARRVGM